jgi:hypothetical protein
MGTRQSRWHREPANGFAILARLLPEGLTIFAYDIRRDPSRLLRVSIPWSKQRRSRMSEAMQPASLARPNFGAVRRNHHPKANANEDAAQQGRVSEIN